MHENQKICDTCGKPMPPGVAQGFCPSCMLGLAQRTESFGGGAADAPPTPDELNGRLQGLAIESLLGSGGMGAVYRAVQTDLDRVVAVKILPESLSQDERFVKRFRREAKALARLDHPGIVRVFGCGVSDGLCYIVMEYVEGTNLREAMHGDKVDPHAALQIVPRICAALAYAHQQGVVHRDIKPENILLAVGGGVKVADFGLAKLGDAPDTSELNLTATGTRLGTVRYMAPEQFDGVDIDHRADIYSLGVVLYELLTGEVPMGNFPLPSETVGTDPRIDRVVQRTLHRKPDQRYQMVSQISEDISRIADGLDVDHEMAAAQTTSWNRNGWGQCRYTSKAKLFGLPIIDIQTGGKHRTSGPGVAKGIIAIGDVAIGGLAMGGSAFGVVAFGGFAMGLNAFGGCAIALQLAMGGCAISGGLSFGGCAIGALFSAGGLCIGYLGLWGGTTALSLSDILRDGPDRGNDLQHAIFETVRDPNFSYYMGLIWLSIILGPLLCVLMTAVYGWSSSGKRARNERVPTYAKGHVARSILTALLMPVIVFAVFYMMDFGIRKNQRMSWLLVPDTTEIELHVAKTQQREGWELQTIDGEEFYVNPRAMVTPNDARWMRYNESSSAGLKDSEPYVELSFRSRGARELSSVTSAITKEGTDDNPHRVILYVDGKPVRVSKVTAKWGSSIRYPPEVLPEDLLQQVQGAANPR
ncbi:MAG: serine/threonine-protein kinase [Planctomycetota bacterium]